MYTSLSTEKREIRILRILPASNPSETIECTLTIVSLQDDPIFDALSYVWGDPGVTETISVDGEPFEATTNLVAGLREIRNEPQSDPVWIDVICINQKNLEEKNHQVPLMRDIYRGAHTTLVWLGQAGEESRLAFQLLTRWVSARDGAVELMEKSNSLPHYRTNTASTDLEELLRVRHTVRDITRDHMAEILVSSFDGKEYDALLTFLLLAYWRRVWITQEFALSKNLVFKWGAFTIPYRTLSSGYKAMRNYDILYGLAGALSDEQVLQLNVCLSQRLEILIGLKERYADSHNVDHVSLFELVNLNKHGIATHKVDRIYALLGLCDTSQYRVPVDYSLPSGQVFQDLTEIFFVDPTVGMNTFCLTGGIFEESFSSNLPTWVPNYANPAFLYHDSSNFYDWSDSRLSASPIVSHGQLELTCIFGLSVKDVRYWSEDIENLFDDMEEWLNVALAGSTIHPSGFPKLQVFFRTLVNDGSCYRSGQSNFRSEIHELTFFQSAAGFMEMLSELARRALRRISAPFPSTLDEWHRLLQRYLTPTECQSFFNLDVPFVLVVFALWLVMSPLKPEIISVTSVLEAFFGSKTSGTYVELPDLDECFGMGAASFEFLRRFARPSQSRKDSFFTTEDGYMGLGPQAVKSGDHICSIPGCRYPVVVRPASTAIQDGRGCFEVVGACYIYGMMHGEIAKDPEVEQKTRRVVFV